MRWHDEELARLVPDSIRRWQLSEHAKANVAYFDKLPDKAKIQWLNNIESLEAEVRRRDEGNLERSFLIDGQIWWVMSETTNGVTKAHVVSDAQREFMLACDTEDAGRA